MKTAFIIAGIIMTLLFGGSIASDIEACNFAEEHPFLTALVGTPNGQQPYTYMPPYTVHEVFMLLGLGAGITLLIVGIKMALPEIKAAFPETKKDEKLPEAKEEVELSEK